jgi:hypothetical protein
MLPTSFGQPAIYRDIIKYEQKIIKTSLVIFFDEIAICGSNVSQNRLTQILSKHVLGQILFGFRHKQSYYIKCIVNRSNYGSATNFIL